MVLKDDWNTNDTFTAADENAIASDVNADTAALQFVVSGSVNGTPTALTVWVGTTAEFNAISSPDPQTVYLYT